jgi:threonine dehydrogenase-like Zn-dependent dehydrogenase
VVVTSGHPLSRLFALTATWCGAVPVILAGEKDPAAVRGVTSFEVRDATADLKALQGLLDRPGAVVVEMTGKAETVDVIMEAIPPAARLLFVGEAREPLTMDFYVNVHRKGIALHSNTVDGLADEESTERARRLLQDPERVAQCRLALTQGAASTGR